MVRNETAGTTTITCPGSAPVVIHDGQNGLFVNWSAEDMAEKIMRLLKDGELQDKFKQAGPETAKQFERKAAIKNYADNLQALI